MLSPAVHQPLCDVADGAVSSLSTMYHSRVCLVTLYALYVHPQCENVLLTSWGWAFLADFASYKPSHLPADNPVSAQCRQCDLYGMGCVKILCVHVKQHGAAWLPSRDPFASGTWGPGQRMLMQHGL